MRKGQKPSFSGKVHNLGENPTDFPRVLVEMNEKLGFSGISNNLRYILPPTPPHTEGGISKEARD